MSTWISVHTCVEGRKEKREGCAREIVVLGVCCYDAAQNGAGRRIFWCQHCRDVHGHHRRLVYVDNGDKNVRKSAQRHRLVLDHAHNNLQLPPISLVVK